MNTKNTICRLIIILLASCISFAVNGQKYYFKHYDLEDGLLQSQVTSICQDNHKQLWIATLGGVDCFDSRQFTPFTVEDGLYENTCFAITKDNRGEIWCGSTKGITGFDRKELLGYPFINQPSGFGIRKILVDKNNLKWALSGKNLYQIQNDRLVKQTVVSGLEDVSAIQISSSGEIYAAVFHQGIYRLKNNRWDLCIKFPLSNNLSANAANELVYDLAFSKSDPDLVYFITAKQLYAYENGSLNVEPFNKNHPDFTCLKTANDSSLWIGTSKGACRYKDHKALFVNEKNGFTGVSIFCIYQDHDNNLWFGTDGAGLYKYATDGLRIFDGTQGLNNDAISCMEMTGKDEVYIATNGGGVFSKKNNQVVRVNFPGKNFDNLKINCLHKAPGNDLWIGTDNSGLWKKAGNKTLRIYPQKGDNPYVSFIAMMEDKDQQLWFATNIGCYYLKDNVLIKVNGINAYCSSLMSIGKDSVLAGTFSGVKMIVNKQVVTNFSPGDIKGLVLSLKYDKQYLFVGTNDRGIFIYNFQSGQHQHITASQGLSSNMVPGMQIINGELWAGTGRGINRYNIKIENNNIHITPAVFNGVPCECSVNGLLNIHDSLWVATTHGVNIYPINQHQPVPGLNVLIENVLVNIPGTPVYNANYRNGYKLPLSLSLPSSGKYISIKFQAIQFNDQKVYYRHQLEGLDRAYSNPVSDNSVDYPDLPPGPYTFKVKAVSVNGTESNVAEYHFSILPAFYQTIGFRMAVGMLILAVLLFIYFYKTYLDRKKRILITEIRLREQENIRIQTAEDFHDDLGNKLTRINMLAELLDSTISPELKNEKLLIGKIRTSASEMYIGAKNILWALNPANDNVGEVLNEIIQFSEGLFENMDLTFMIKPYDDEIEQIKLPLSHSHNMVLIFKELITNSLKHSKAKIVTFSIERISNEKICFTIADDGEGYRPDQLFTGNGLRNIRTRAKKLNGEILISSTPHAGTATRLIMPI